MTQDDGPLPHAILVDSNGRKPSALATSVLAIVHFDPKTTKLADFFGHNDFPPTVQTLYANTPSILATSPLMRAWRIYPKPSTSNPPPASTRKLVCFAASSCSGWNLATSGDTSAKGC